jgi:hypothetical protein
MSTTKDIEALRDNQKSESAAFREQIARARELREQTGTALIQPSQGVDRSNALTPIQRPTLVRSLPTA